MKNRIDQYLAHVLTQIARLMAQIKIREKNVQRMEKSIETARVSPISIVMVTKLMIFSEQLGAGLGEARGEHWEEIFRCL